MYYKKSAGIILLKNAMISFVSRKWKMWKTVVTPTTCYYCLFMKGRILSIDDPELAKIPVHPNCGCTIEAVRATQAGTATNDGTNGVDLFVALYGTLPKNCQMRQGEFGTKQILIMRVVIEITAVCCILMMGWCL